MPNWVQNEIIFENAGDEKVAALIRELKAATESEDGVFDFNKLIPMPESLNVEVGPSQDWAIAYYVTERLTIPVDQTNLRDLIYDSFNDDRAAEVVSSIKNAIAEGCNEDWDKVYENGRQYVYNYEHYGCFTWYEWCCRHWGTKRNACEPAWNLDDGMLVFQTAWTAPFPVIEALASKYPELEFTHRWADEDIGNNYGEMRWSEGCVSDMDFGDERLFAMSE